MPLKIQEQVFGEKIEREIANFELYDIAGVEKVVTNLKKSWMITTLCSVTSKLHFGKSLA